MGILHRPDRLEGNGLALAQGGVGGIHGSDFNGLFLGKAGEEISKGSQSISLGKREGGGVRFGQPGKAVPAKDIPYFPFIQNHFQIGKQKLTGGIPAAQGHLRIGCQHRDSLYLEPPEHPVKVRAGIFLIVQPQLSIELLAQVFRPPGGILHRQGQLLHKSSALGSKVSGLLGFFRQIFIRGIAIPPQLTLRGGACLGEHAQNLVVLVIASLMLPEKEAPVKGKVVDANGEIILRGGDKQNAFRGKVLDGQPLLRQDRSHKELRIQHFHRTGVNTEGARLPDLD